VNDEGIVIGSRQLPISDRQESFTWSRLEGFRWLGTLGGDGKYNIATDINNSGYVVGSSPSPDGTGHACLWTEPTEMTDLDKLFPDDRSSIAQGINDSGQVVGWSRGTDIDRAFIWTEEGGMRELDSFGEETSARGINDSGTIVGYANIPGIDPAPMWRQHATIWQNGAIADLNTLISSEVDYLLTIARGINDSGQIIASGYVPEPATFLMLAAGSLMLRMKRRRA